MQAPKSMKYVYWEVQKCKFILFAPSQFIQMVWFFFVFVFALLSSYVSILEVFYFIFSCSGFEPVGFFVDCLPGMTQVPLGSKTWCYNTNRRRTTQCFGVYEMMSLLGRQDRSSVTGRMRKIIVITGICHCILPRWTVALQ